MALLRGRSGRMGSPEALLRAGGSLGEVEGFTGGGEAPQGGWESFIECRGSGGKRSLGMPVWLGLDGWAEETGTGGVIERISHWPRETAPGLVPGMGLAEEISN